MTKDYYIEEYLKKRGYGSKDEIRRLYEFEEADLRKVSAMHGGRKLLNELSRAANAGDPVVVYGDYDADGIMASFILYSGLVRLLPDKVKIFINNRFEDGYNITPESMEKMLSLYPETKLIITCDNGIGAGEALEIARGKGVTVLVTDHHEQGHEMPAGIPAVDEKSIVQKKEDEENGFAREEFCGAELARRVVRELYEMKGLAESEAEFLDSLYAYSGFATITDSVPMNPANHFVAKRGLEKIKADKGFFEILKNETGNGERRINADTIGFSYGPLFNAAGRVAGTAKNALAAPVLFAMGYEAECGKAVHSLISLNEMRKEMCRKEDDLAFEMIEANGWQKDPFILVSGEEFSEGINGLTASHIVSRYGVPAAVLSPVKNDATTYKGSARSREGFDLFKAFSSHPDLIKAGGHPMAAGLSVKEADIEKVREILRRDASGISYQDPEPDFIFTARNLTLEDVENMQQAFASLEPFGPGLEPPRICIHGSIYPVRPLKDVHAKMTLQDRSRDGYYINLLWWNHLQEAEELAELAGSGTGNSAGAGYKVGNSAENGAGYNAGNCRELVFMGEPSVNEYNGKFSIQFKVNQAGVY